MARKGFTKEQLKKLQGNPNVLSASEKRIVYTTEFKEKFIEEYKKGMGPREIFIKAGFDVEALGYKRIERASDRWRLAYDLPPHRDRLRETATLRDKLREQDSEIARLETELSEIRAELKALRG